jgi:plasmid stabilization system protein ParE
MQIYNLNMLPIAREDLADIYCYIALDNPDAALKTTDNILDIIDALREFPNRYPLVSDAALAKQGYRMLIEGSYIAFFKVFEYTEDEKGEVLVYRVLHGKRDYRLLLEM